MVGLWPRWTCLQPGLTRSWDSLKRGHQNASEEEGGVWCSWDKSAFCLWGMWGGGFAENIRELACLVCIQWAASDWSMLYVLMLSHTVERSIPRLSSRIYKNPHNYASLASTKGSYDVGIPLPNTPTLCVQWTAKLSTRLWMIDPSCMTSSWAIRWRSIPRLWMNKNQNILENWAWFGSEIASSELAKSDQHTP